MRAVNYVEHKALILFSNNSKELTTNKIWSASVSVLGIVGLIKYDFVFKAYPYRGSKIKLVVDFTNIKDQVKDTPFFAFFKDEFGSATVFESNGKQGIVLHSVEDCVKLSLTLDAVNA